MKLAWLCYMVIPDGDGYGPPVIKFYEPDAWEYHKVVPIIYAEIIEK